MMKKMVMQVHYQVNALYRTSELPRWALAAAEAVEGVSRMRHIENCPA
jgi:hypothetical protein